MVLRDSTQKSAATHRLARSLGASALGRDVGGLRSEWLKAMESCENLQVPAQTLASR
jgi:hypothetical protein